MSPMMPGGPLDPFPFQKRSGAKRNRIWRVETANAFYWIKEGGTSSELEEQLLNEIIDSVFYVGAPLYGTVPKGVEEGPLAIFEKRYKPIYELVKKTNGEIWFSEGLLLIDTHPPGEADNGQLKEDIVALVAGGAAITLTIISIFEVNSFLTTRRRFVELAAALLLGDQAYSMDKGQNSYLEKAAEELAGLKAPNRRPVLDASELYPAVLIATLEKYVRNCKDLKPKIGEKPNIYVVGLEGKEVPLWRWETYFKHRNVVENELKEYGAVLASKLDDEYFKRFKELGVQVDREAVRKSFSTQIVSRYYYSKDILIGSSWKNKQTGIKFLD